MFVKRKVGKSLGSYIAIVVTYYFEDANLTIFFNLQINILLLFEVKIKTKKLIINSFELTFYNENEKSLPYSTFNLLNFIYKL